jgi:hypothetical protein
MRLNPLNNKIEEILRSDFECTSTDLKIGGENNEFFYYGCVTSSGFGSRYGVGNLVDLESKFHNPSIDFYDFFKIGEIGHGQTTRLLFCHNSLFKCRNIYLNKHTYDTITDNHVLTTMYNLDLSAESHFIYGYKKIGETNSNFVFGKLDTVYKIWMIEMTQDGS